MESTFEDESVNEIAVGMDSTAPFFLTITIPFIISQRLFTLLK